MMPLPKLRALGPHLGSRDLKGLRLVEAVELVTAGVGFRVVDFQAHSSGR